MTEFSAGIELFGGEDQSSEVLSNIEESEQKLLCDVTG